MIKKYRTRDKGGRAVVRGLVGAAFLAALLCHGVLGAIGVGNFVVILIQIAALGTIGVFVVRLPKAAVRYELEVDALVIYSWWVFGWREKYAKMAGVEEADLAEKATKAFPDGAFYIARKSGRRILMPCPVEREAFLAELRGRVSR